MIEKNSDVYYRNAEWVKKAVLHYMDKTGYNLYPRANDAEISFADSGGAIVTVTKKQAVKDTRPVVNLSEFWSWLKCSVLRIG